MTSMTSNGSFESSDFISDSTLNDESQKRKAPQNLFSLLESVHPPSNTPDSMLSSCESPSSVRLSKADSESEEVSNIVAKPSQKFRMGSKFKQSIQQIEELKKRGKREIKELSEKVFQREKALSDFDTDKIEASDANSDVVVTNSRGPIIIDKTHTDPLSTTLCNNNNEEVKGRIYNFLLLSKLKL